LNKEKERIITTYNNYYLNISYREELKSKRSIAINSRFRGH